MSCLLNGEQRAYYLLVDTYFSYLEYDVCNILLRYLPFALGDGLPFLPITFTSQTAEGMGDISVR